jgi:hypothetical protein
MGTGQRVAVFAAYGHTGRFVVAELRKRGFVPLLLGRDATKLYALAESHPDLPVRQASVDQPAALDDALAGAAAVINCAGPFGATAGPIIEAALRAGIPYVDVGGEIEPNLNTFAEFADRVHAEGAIVVPAMAFYGGLGDLLVTALMDDWTEADEAHLAYGLSSWRPTPGTRFASLAARRLRNGRRVRYTHGRLEHHNDDPPTLPWPFPAPLGSRPVIGDFITADAITIHSHLSIPAVHTYMSVEAVNDLLTPDTPPPAPVDQDGRSDQTFLLDVRVRSAGTERRAIARGQDIYAVSAPLAVQAVHRILNGQTKTVGVASAGHIFDAPDFLNALSADIHIELP